MRSIILPDPKTYALEGSEIGDIVGGLRYTYKQLKEKFPCQLPEFTKLLEYWEWEGIDPCHKLILIIEALLDNRSSNEYKFKDISFKVKKLADKAKKTNHNIYNQWPEFPAYRLEITNKKGTRWFENQEGIWLSSTDLNKDINSKNLDEFYFGEWDDYIYNLSEFIRKYLPKEKVIKNKKLTNINYNDAKFLLDNYLDRSSFSGLASNDDYQAISSLMTDLAEASNDYRLKLIAKIRTLGMLTTGSNYALYNDNIFLLGDYYQIAIKVNKDILEYKAQNFGKFKWFYNNQTIEDEEVIKLAKDYYKLINNKNFVRHKTIYNL